MLKQSKVECSVVGDGWSVSIGKGKVVDLAAKVGPGIKLADVVNPDWFEEVGVTPEIEGLPADEADGQEQE